MAYADPQSITISGTANSLPRTGSGIGTGTFSTSDGGVVMIVAHQSNKRVRRNVRFTSNKVVPDALQPSVNVPVNCTVSVVLDAPKMGFTAAEQQALLAAVAAWMITANLTKLVGGEA